MIKDNSYFFAVPDFISYFFKDRSDSRLFEFMSYDYDYLRLMPIPKVCRGKDGIYRLDGRNMYEINLQAAIWKKSYLMQVLREDGLSAWQVEAMQKVSSPSTNSNREWTCRDTAMSNSIKWLSRL